MDLDEDRITRQTQRVLHDAARTLAEVYKRELKDVVTQASNLRRANDDLSKENFSFQQRVNALSRQLGYNSFVDAERNLPDDASQRLSSAADTSALNVTSNNELMARISHLQEKVISVKDENRSHLDQIHRLQQALDAANQRVQLSERERLGAADEISRNKARLSELESRLDEERQVYEKNAARKDMTIQELETRVQKLESHVPHSILKAVSNLSGWEDKENLAVTTIHPEVPQIVLSSSTTDTLSSGYEVRYKDLTKQHSHLQQLYDQLRTKVESSEKEMFELKSKFKLANHRWTTSRKRWEVCKESMVRGLNQQRLQQQARIKRQAMTPPKVDDPLTDPAKPKDVDLAFWQGRLLEIDALDKDVDAANEALTADIPGNVKSPPPAPTGPAQSSHPSKRIRVESQSVPPNSEPPHPARLFLAPFSESTPVKKGSNTQWSQSPNSTSSPGTATESEPPLTQHQRIQGAGVRASPTFQRNTRGHSREPSVPPAATSSTVAAKSKAIPRREMPSTPQRSTDRPLSRRITPLPVIKAEPIDEPMAGPSNSVLQPATTSKPKNHNRARSSPPDSPHLARVRSPGHKTVLGKRKSDANVPASPPPSKAAQHKAPAPAAMEQRDDRAGPVLANVSGPSSGPKEAPKDKDTNKLIQDLKRMPHAEYMKTYAPFKGHGRYGKTKVANPANQTMNTVYEINPARNDGLDYQYDAVVRNKDQRKKMDATDCECCKDYYKAVGQLDAIARGPMWRSPSQKQLALKRPCIHYRATSEVPTSPPSFFDDMSTSQQDQTVSNHQKEISRHRHNWARPRTPPGYWNIGFPSTQELAEINRRADENDQAKRRMMEQESRKSDGRYQRRAG